MTFAPGHPFEPLLAVSGIDSTIKIFSPDARAQEAARLGIKKDDDNEEQEPLESRKRMQDNYSIMSQNDALRRGGNRDAFITVSPDGPRFALRTIGISFAEWLTWFDD